MINVLAARLQQKKRTIPYPGKDPVLPDRFRGLPAIKPGRCAADCGACTTTCPTDAVTLTPKGPVIDLGRCLFCGACAAACPEKAILPTSEYRIATRTREGLVLSGNDFKRAEALSGELRRVFGRSLKLRQVSAAGCNACEADINVLTTVVFDLGRFGIQFVASPRHADGILVTGCLSRNMMSALVKTWDAVAEPKLVIAVGACAISGGPFIDHPEAHNGIEGTLPVDLYIPGCPPHPMTILDGLLRLISAKGVPA